MASSSSIPEILNQDQDQQQLQQHQGQLERAAYLLAISTMKLKEYQLRVQVENPVDFSSLIHHSCNIKKFYNTQKWKDYFRMLNGPTYKALVRHFWVRATIFDRQAADAEERDLVLCYPELVGKSREEMMLEPFNGTEIRSTVMGVPIRITQEVIALVIGVEASGVYSGIEINNPKNSFWNDIVNMTLYNPTTPKKYDVLDMEKKMLFKIQYENLLPKGGGSDRPSLAHKVFIHHLIKGDKINLPKYIFKYMEKELWKSQNKDRVWVPYGRLLSKIFHQGGIINALNQTRFYTIQMLDTVVGKVINGKTLKNMQLIREFTPLKTDMSESMVVS